LREQAKHPGPSAAENGQQRAAEFAFATSLFATSRSLAAAKKPTGRGWGGRAGGRGARTPHGQTEAAKRADGRSQGQTGACQKGSEPGMGADRSGQREEAPGTRADGKRGKNKKEGRVLGTQKWAKGTGPDTRADRNRQRALEEASNYLLILTHPTFFHCPFWYQKDSPSPFPPQHLQYKVTQ